MCKSNNYTNLYYPNVQIKFLLQKYYVIVWLESSEEKLDWVNESSDGESTGR